MFLEGIIAISGQPGLYKKVSQAKNSIIVESIETGKRMPAFSASKLSSLQDVAIYTNDKEKPLADVLSAAFEKASGFAELTHKSSERELLAWFEEILPEYDREKVYISDIRKVLHWFSILEKANILTGESIEAYRKELEESEKQEGAE